MSDKKLVFSGVQPTGNLHLGNYLGALKNWNHLQNEYNSIFLVVDMHALTVNQIPSELRQRCLSFIAQYIACGIDPDKSRHLVNKNCYETIKMLIIKYVLGIIQ